MCISRVQSLAPVLSVSTTTTCVTYSYSDAALRAPVVQSSSLRSAVSTGQVARPATTTQITTSTQLITSPLEQLPQHHQHTFDTFPSPTLTSQANSLTRANLRVSQSKPTSTVGQSELIRLLLLKTFNTPPLLQQREQQLQRQQVRTRET